METCPRCDSLLYPIFGPNTFRDARVKPGSVKPENLHYLKCDECGEEWYKQEDLDWMIPPFEEERLRR